MTAVSMTTFFHDGRHSKKKPTDQKVRRFIYQGVIGTIDPSALYESLQNFTHRL